MEKAFRISVRELVAFSCFAPDIVPVADTEALLTGALAHKARQRRSEGQSEVSIRHAFAVGDANVLVYGRMDLFTDGDVPFIEEIKHTLHVPDSVLPEHRLQAVCYAAMLTSEKPCEAVKISVCYVNLQGETLRSFEEQLTADELAAQMDALLLPYAAWALREAQHREERDASLRTLSFPFDRYRKGQRELAVQVYTAITRKKRLFASLPTGTGKSAAVLYPALKALGEGHTERVVYLTARNTARQSPLNALGRLCASGMKARCCVLTARETLCPAPARCHPDDCPRARGHFLRQPAAIEELLAAQEWIWDETVIRRYADLHELCPFEFALTLSELADVLMMDLNYAFDPFAQLKRLFQKQKHFTLLVDEAHHTVERVRENLSGTLDSMELVRLRMDYGKAYGRKTAVYRALTALIHALREIPAGQDEQTLESLPEGIAEHVEALFEAAIDAVSSGGVQEIIRLCLSYRYAQEHLDEDYAILLEKKGRERALCLYCLLPGKEIARVTKGLRGAVFFSATLNPLPAMKALLGGGEEDACFQLPSPFPAEHLEVVRRKVDTRYHQRGQTAGTIAHLIHELLELRPGNTLVFFPSYAYLELVRAQLDESRLPKLWIQTHEMEEDDRAAFLQAFQQTEEPVLGLCVLGGLFSEGIDLPGEKLINAVIAGVGLPVPTARLNAVKECYHRHFGDGFAYACRIPGMQKVLQAAGRVIRSETDRGMVLLLDERYFDPAYTSLMPYEWRLHDGTLFQAAARLEEL